MKKPRSALLIVLIIGTFTVLVGSPLQTKAAVLLETAGDFAVLGGSMVTNTGPSVIEGGHVGVSPGTAIVGFPPGIVVPPHTIHAADAVALQAQSDLTIAYNTAAGLAPTQSLTGLDLGGQTLSSGVYFFASSAQLTGTLTLDAMGNSDAEFVFQIGSTLTTASNSSVVLINGAQACNVFWQVGSSATLGTNTIFVGNILALTSITLVTGVDVDGRLLARNGAVTLDTNTISAANCVDCVLDTDCPPGAPFCDPVTGVCVECVTDGSCDDGLFCNGPETCVAAECQPGSDPCLPLACDEATDTCNLCFGSSCPPAAPFCDPDTGSCVECLADGDCDDQEVCTVDSCNPTTHQCEYSCTDEVDPTGDCGDTDISVSCEEPVPAYFPTFTDNCDTRLIFDFVTTDSAGTCPQEHTIQQSVTATDICGNATTCTRIVRVVDNGPPVVECPPDTSVSCDAPRTPAQTGSATATDSCDPSVASPTFTDENVLNGCNGTGTIRRTWTAMDDCGNTGSCVQTITVMDDASPVLTCPPDITRECGESTDPADTGTATATDDCDTSITPTFTDESNLSGCDGTGTIIRTWSAQDDCGNPSTCTQTITIVDTVGPMITCPPAATGQCGESTDPADTGSATATDSCDASVTPTFTDEVDPGGCVGGTGTITRTWTAMDDCGNEAMCAQTVLFVDTQAPMLMCPERIAVECRQPEGVPVADVRILVAAVDECDDDVQVTDDRPDFFYPPSCGARGPTRVTLTATDDCGNSTSCTVEVEVFGQMCCPGTMDGDLTLMPASIDLRQDTGGAVTTKARFDIWNQNEVRFSGTERCISCWDQTLLSRYNSPNHFLMRNIHTDKGKARIDGVASGTVCDAATGVVSIADPLLGILVKEIRFDGRPPQTERSALNLPGTGRQSARIVYDQPSAARLAELVGDIDLPAGTLAQRPSLLDDLDDEGPAPEPFSGLTKESRASTTEKGSVLYYPNVEIKWDAAGSLIQDTFIELTNDYPQSVYVQLYFVNGDPPAGAVFVGDPPIRIERAHPGWNNVDAAFRLTANEPTYWSVLTGQPRGLQPFTILDPGNPPGRPDPDPANRGGRTLRGFIVAWALSPTGQAIHWNHLSGSATVIHYRDASAFDYKPVAFQCVSSVAQGAMCGATRGVINLDGVEYDAAPDRLLMDFYSVGSQALSHPGIR